MRRKLCGYSALRSDKPCTQLVVSLLKHPMLKIEDLQAEKASRIYKPSIVNLELFLGHCNAMVQRALILRNLFLIHYVRAWTTATAETLDSRTPSLLSAATSESSATALVSTAR